MTPLDKFWQEIDDSLIPFISSHPRTKKMIEGLIGEMIEEVQKSKKAGQSTHRYFEMLEEIAHKLISIHGFDIFTTAYSEEKGWIKTEIKNTLNFAFMAMI